MKSKTEIEEYFTKLVKENPEYYGKLLAGTFIGNKKIVPYSPEYLPHKKYAENLGFIQIDDVLFDKETIELNFTDFMVKFYFSDEIGSTLYKDLKQNINFMLDILCRYDINIDDPFYEFDQTDKLKYSRILQEAYEKRSDEDKLLLQLKYPELILLEENMDRSKEELSKICSESFTKDQFEKLKELILKGEIT